MNGIPHDQRLARIDLTENRRLAVWHRRGDTRCLTELSLEAKDADGNFCAVRRISIPHAALWLVRDALEAACVIAAKERR